MFSGCNSYGFIFKKGYVVYCVLNFENNEWAKNIVSDSDVGDFEEEESSVFPQNMEINVCWKTVNQ